MEIFFFHIFQAFGLHLHTISETFPLFKSILLLYSKCKLSILVLSTSVLTQGVFSVSMFAVWGQKMLYKCLDGPLSQVIKQAKNADISNSHNVYLRHVSVDFNWHSNTSLCQKKKVYLVYSHAWRPEYTLAPITKSVSKTDDWFNLAKGAKLLQ